MKLNSRIATAVAFAMALGAGAAQAATVSFADGTVNPGNPGVSYSQQGQVLSGNAAAQTLPIIVVTLGADYSVNDNITLRINGTAAPTVGGATNGNLTQVPTTVGANAATDNGIFCTEAGTALPLAAVDATPPIIVSFITRNGNDISLRVTQKNVANTVGVICQITGVQVTAPSLTNLGTISGSWAATTAITNIAFDAGSALNLANVIDQFTTGGLVALNGIVNVNAPSLRGNFTIDDDAGPGGNQDTLQAQTNDARLNTAITGPAVTLTTAVVTLNGNFSHLDANGDGNCSNDALGGVPFSAADGAAAIVAAANCQSVTYTYTPDGTPVGTVLHKLAFTGADGGKVLVAPQSFTADVRYNYVCTTAAPNLCNTGTTGNETDSVAAGAWTLNGFQAFVNYMPYGGNVSQIIYLANKGSQSGAIQVDARNEAGTACSFAAGTINGNRVSVISGAVKNGVEACYGANWTGKVHMTITANIPQADGEVYSAYNVGGNDRGTVVNTSNGR